MELLDLVFPKKCLECGREGQYICPDCVAKVRLARPICPYCERDSIEGATHIKCTKRGDLGGLVSIWMYEGVIRKALITLKYKYATRVEDELIDYIATSLKQKLVLHDSCLVPIPMHWYRQNTRGFNQSIEMGKILAEKMGWGFVPDILVRKKSTVPQVELKGDARRKNLKGVFSVNSNRLSDIKNSVLIFDDVFTTGSTLTEAAKVLKLARIENVWGLTVCR